MELIAAANSLTTSRTVRVSEHSRIPLKRGELLDLATGDLLLSPQIIGKGYIRVQADKTQVVVHAGPYIGLIPLNQHVTLEIVPRVPISNLVRVLSASGIAPQRLPETLRLYATQNTPVGSIRDELATALINQIRLIGASGPHYEYESRKEETSFPKGRILLNETVTHLLATGKRHVVRTARFERNINTLPNQLLKLALLTLASSYRNGNQNGQVSNKLGAIREAMAVFTVVTTLNVHSSQLLGMFNRMPSTRDYYQPALALAQLILGTRGLDFDSSSGDILLPSMLWKMDDIFEDYIRWGLQRQFLAAPSSFEIADGNIEQRLGGGGQRLFAHGPDSRLANPDLVVMQTDDQGNRTPIAVFDIKYKPEQPKREDLNQVLAYAVSYQVGVVGIVSLAQPGKPSKLTYMGGTGPVLVYHYAFQLGGTDLAVEESALAQELLPLLADSVSRKSTLMV